MNAGTRNRLLGILKPYGQEHVLDFWEDLNPAEKRTLAQQIEEINFELLEQLIQGGSHRRDVRELLKGAGPPPAFRLNAGDNRFGPQEARERGEEALREGQVGVVLVAGGQGSRLGFDHPKGMFPIGPVSRRTLFQVHVEKIVARAARHGQAIPLYLMTSPATHRETVEFFHPPDPLELNKSRLAPRYKGRLQDFCRQSVKIFCQGTMPAVDKASGKMLLAEKGSLALSPDGHGGMLAALDRSGLLGDIRDRGIKHLFYLQVDNPLVDICAAEFIGYHLRSKSEMSTQVIAKRTPLEKVGNVVQAHGKLQVVEYSEFNEVDQDIIGRLADGAPAGHYKDLPREAKGNGPPPPLRFWAGSIAVHVFDVGFLRDMADRLDRDPNVLPFHRAEKKVAYVNSAGRKIKPRKPNAIKFERFIFDLMPLAANAIVVEVDPPEAFAPLKNASEKKLKAMLKSLLHMRRRQDTPETVRAAMVAQHRRWLGQAGIEVGDDVRVYISPLVALDAEELAERLIL
jgi:UDP-N-acetylglucosamine/UDP-N-acetylgalactosamine diphosphorylase